MKALFIVLSLSLFSICLDAQNDKELENLGFNVNSQYHELAPVISADGKLFTCLFSAAGHDVKGLLRQTQDDDLLRKMVSGLWAQRTDRYSEERGEGQRAKAEMSYLGG